jgi:hypothetical protein
MATASPSASSTSGATPTPINGRTHGNQQWEFDDDGLMRRRAMSANDYPIQESDRRYRS